MYVNVTHKRGTGEMSLWKDSRVSLKAKGLWFSMWFTMTDHPDEQERFAVSRFVEKYVADGIDSTFSAFNELKYFKYVEVKGHGTASKYTINDRTEV